MIARIKIDRVVCSRGAPMGRVAFGFDTAAVCRLSRLRLDRGGYHAGGAYWG